jgi:MarR family transcriptional regulator, organic hydroperoxide resistance regulator
MTATSPTEAASPQLTLDDQVCFALYTASRLVTRAYGPVLTELGLTYPQYITMIALWEAGGPLSVGDLGNRLRLDSGTLTPLLKRLQAQGLLTRIRDPQDERRVLIQLTSQGAALRHSACAVPEHLASRYGADHTQLASLKRILDQLIETLDQPKTVA